MNRAIPSPQRLLPVPSRSVLLGLSMLLILSAVLPRLATFAPTTAIPNTSQMAPWLLPSLQKLPLSFMPNVGQTDEAVHFQVKGLGGTIFFASQEVVLALPTGRDTARSYEPALMSNAAVPEATAVVRMQFVGSSSATEVTALSALPGVINTFIGNDPAHWHTHLPTYAGIVYDQLYPGINLRYEGSEGQLKGTYLVAAGADPGLIRWRYAGASTVLIDNATGQLIVNLQDSKITPLTETAPIAWQEVQGQHVPISVRYDLSGDGSVGFHLGAYDQSLPITIDPTLEYSTLLGGRDTDWAWDIAVDATGSAYITGRTRSDNFPMQHSYDTSYNGGTSNLGYGDIFVSKLSPDGKSLVYSTYIGGNNDEIGIGIALDSMSNAYVVGDTYSSDFPVQQPYHSQIGGGNLDCVFNFLLVPCADAVVVKLNAVGDKLLYGTYFGGTYSDGGFGIALQDDNRIYVTGYTNRCELGTSDQSFQKTHGGGTWDAYIAKLDTSQSGAQQLQYVTCLGGGGDDMPFGLAARGDVVYVAGYTNSQAPKPFPVTANAFATQNSGGYDGFVARLDISKQGQEQLTFGSYLGSDSEDQITDLAVDSSGNIYVTGFTGNGTTKKFPIKDPAFAPHGDVDAFVARLAPSASGDAQLPYSIVLGGTAADRGQSIALGSGNTLVIAGSSQSTDFQPLKNPIQGTNQGQNDAILVHLDPGVTGQDQVLFSTYFGGSGYDRGQAVAIDPAGCVYLAGIADSVSAGTQFPTSAGVFQTANAGGNDGFVAKINPSSASSAGSGASCATAPQLIADLDVQAAPEAGRAVLKWSNPGSITRYQIGYSDKAYTGTTWWDNAVEATGAPAPLAIGSTQIYTTPFQLPTNKQWYFAVRSYDAAGNASPTSNIASLIDSGFRPQVDGYGFYNFIGVQTGDFTFEDMKHMFGVVVICIDVAQCTNWNNARWSAERWYEWNMSGVLSSGRCEGISTTSLRFFINKVTGSRYESFKDFKSSAPNTNLLTVTDSLATDPGMTLRRHISYYQMLQKTDPLAATTSNALNTEPQQTLQNLKSWFTDGQHDYPWLVFHRTNWRPIIDEEYRPESHVVVPYAIESADGRNYRVKVYENNYPNGQDAYVDMNIDGSWKYEIHGKKLYHVDDPVGVFTYIGAVRVSANDAPASTPWFSGADALTTTTFSPYLLNVLLSNDQGRRLGSNGQQWFEEIPNAYAQITSAGSETTGITYYAPAASDYTLTLRGQATSSGQPSTVTQFGPGYAMVASGIRLQASSNDQLVVARDGSSVSYTANEARSMNLTLTHEETAASREFAVNAIAVGAGRNAMLSNDAAQQTLRFVSGASVNSTYGLRLGLRQSGQEHRFAHAGIAIKPGDTHVINYGQWSGDTITLQIDHGSDGTIDETIVLSNQDYNLYLPLTRR